MLKEKSNKSHFNTEKSVVVYIVHNKYVVILSYSSAF